MVDTNMVKKLAIVLLFCAFDKIASNEEVTQAEDLGVCEKIDGSVNCVNSENIRLTRIEGGEVDSIHDIEIEEGRVLHMKTACTKPLVFEIEDFLSAEECEHFISVAKGIGLKESKTEMQAFVKNIQLLDIDGDKRLSLDEMHQTLVNSYDIYLDDDDLTQMYEILSLDTNEDKYISQEEMSKLKPKSLREFLFNYITEHPEKHSRYSKQTWLYPDRSTDEIFARLQQRVSTVVQLPLSLIKLSDFQVVNYGVKGHYNAHLDSTHVDPAIPCCDRGKTPRCRICRYMTVLFYLNDVEGGGETAFPVANNETVDQKVLMVEDMQNLYKKCDEAKLHVEAKKGKAVIWYNHFIDEKTGWMGEVDRYTLHGGCPVTEGEKWIANFWIKTTNDREKDISRMEKLYAGKN